MHSFAKGFSLALIGSIVANLIVMYVLRPFVIDPAMPLQSLTFPHVAGLTALGAGAATVVYALMRRFMAQPNRAFFWISLVVLIVSFIPDYLIIGTVTGPFAGATLPACLTLMLMHVVAAVIIVWALVRLWGPRMAAASS